MAQLTSVLLAIILGLVALSLPLATATEYHGATYQKLSAQDKYTLLQKGITADPHTAGFYPAWEQAELFVESMETTFKTVADDMPKQMLGIQTRPKLVHQAGAIGTIAWTPVANNLNYSGIFASGTPNAIIRFSSGPNPTTEGNASGLVPGFAIKFTRDGVPSANIFTLATIADGVSFNFFEHDFSNHVPDVPYTADSQTLLLRSTFAKASAWPFYLGLSDVAEYDVYGRKEAKPRFPWRLIFHPTTKLHSAFPSTNPHMPFYEQLVNGVEPGPIFDVYAIDSPTNDAKVNSAVQIAQLILRSPLSESKFGDRTLFFQHCSLEADMTYHPEWHATAKAIQDQQRSQTQQAIYPDLPWN